MQEAMIQSEGTKLKSIPTPLLVHCEVARRVDTRYDTIREMRPYLSKCLRCMLSEYDTVQYRKHDTHIPGITDAAYDTEY